MSEANKIMRELSEKMIEPAEKRCWFLHRWSKWEFFHFVIASSFQKRRCLDCGWTQVAEGEWA